MQRRPPFEEASCGIEIASCSIYNYFSLLVTFRSVKAFAAPSVSTRSSCGATMGSGSDAGDGGRDDPNRGRKIGGERDFRPFPDEEEEDDYQGHIADQIELRYMHIVLLNTMQTYITIIIYFIPSSF